MKGAKHCKHPKLSKVHEDGYQYCVECNTAFPVQRPPCNHAGGWVDEQELTITSDREAGIVKGFIYIQKCRDCNEIKKTPVMVRP